MEHKILHKLQKIEKDLLALSGKMLSFMISASNNNRKFENYLHMVVTKQTRMQRDIELIVAHLQIKFSWDNEEDLEYHLENHNKEGK